MLTDAIRAWVIEGAVRQKSRHFTQSQRLQQLLVNRPAFWLTNNRIFFLEKLLQMNKTPAGARSMTNVTAQIHAKQSFKRYLP